MVQGAAGVGGGRRRARPAGARPGEALTADAGYRDKPERVVRRSSHGMRVPSFVHAFAALIAPMRVRRTASA